MTGVITELQKMKDIDSLTKKERKIYYSIMQSFPATNHYSALNAAYQGGVNFQFILK